MSPNPDVVSLATALSKLSRRVDTETPPTVVVNGVTCYDVRNLSAFYLTDGSAVQRNAYAACYFRGNDSPVSVIISNNAEGRWPAVLLMLNADNLFALRIGTGIVSYPGHVDYIKTVDTTDAPVYIYPIAYHNFDGLEVSRNAALSMATYKLDVDQPGLDCRAD